MFYLRKFSLFKFLLNVISKAKYKLQVNYPSVYLLFFDKRNRWRISRFTLSYIYGLLMAFSFWHFILLDLWLPLDFMYSTLIFLIMFIGLGYTFSMKIRCIVLLVCIGFWGKSGRSYLRAVIFALIIAGPIKNLALNGKEVIRVFACSSILTYNMTKNRFDLMSKPFRNAIYGMKQNMSTLKKTVGKMEGVVMPIVEEIEADGPENETGSILTRKREVNEYGKTHDNNNEALNDADKYQEHYKMKINKRCKDQLVKGENKCKDAFSKAYDSCNEKLPSIINTMFCWPMKITFVCNIKLFGFAAGKKDICDPSDVIDDNLGENYINLKTTENKFVANLSSVDVNYAFVSPKQIPGVSNAQDTGKHLVSEFVEKKLFFDKCMEIVNAILAFIFLKTIIGAVSYHKQYVNNIEYDNIYITGYFKRIETRRTQLGKSTLMPLKKVESNTIRDPTDFGQSKGETKTMMVHILKLVLELTTMAIFTLLDHIVYVLLTIIAKNSKIDYFQEGEHTVTINVNGTGIIANLIRSTMEGFNTNETISTFLTNEPCLPRPTNLSTWFYCKLILLYLTILILIWNERIVFRLRRICCSYFYPKQEKRRILYLYNKMLKRRRQLFLAFRAVVQEEIEKNIIRNRLNLLMIIRLKYPIWFSWLRMFGIARRACLICKEPEPKKDDANRPYNFAKCKTPGCYFVHCEECWFLVGEICLACQKPPETDKEK